MVFFFISRIIFLASFVVGNDLASIRGTNPQRQYDPYEVPSGGDRSGRTSLIQDVRTGRAEEIGVGTGGGVRGGQPLRAGACNILLGEFDQFYAPNTYHFKVSGLPDALADSDVEIKFDVNADTDGDHEYITINDENGDSIMIYQGIENTEHCAETFYEESETVSAARFNGWNADDEITFTLIPSAGVNNLCGEDSRMVKISLSFDPASGVCPESVPYEVDAPGTDLFEQQVCSEVVLGCEIDLGKIDGLYNGNTLSFISVNNPDALARTIVTVEVNLQGDIDRDHEIVTVKDENDSVLMIYSGNAEGNTHCTGHTLPVEVSSFLFNQWNADDALSFSIETSDTVSYVCHSTGMYGNIILKYDSCGPCPKPV